MTREVADKTLGLEFILVSRTLSHRGSLRNVFSFIGALLGAIVLLTYIPIDSKATERVRHIGRLILGPVRFPKDIIIRHESVDMKAQPSLIDSEQHIVIYRASYPHGKRSQCRTGSEGCNAWFCTWGNWATALYDDRKLTFNVMTSSLAKIPINHLNQGIDAEYRVLDRCGSWERTDNAIQFYVGGFGQIPRSLGQSQSFLRDICKTNGFRGLDIGKVCIDGHSDKRQERLSRHPTVPCF